MTEAHDSPPDSQLEPSSTTDAELVAAVQLPNRSFETDPLLIDLYKMAVEMADRISSRRATSNAFYITVQTALVAVLGIATPTIRQAPWWAVLIVAVAGLSVSGSWWLQLRSYRDLNRAKFIVINSMESSLPRRIYSDEWEILKTQPWHRRYTELGITERIIPFVFGALYIFLFIGRVALAHVPA